MTKTQSLQAIANKVAMNSIPDSEFRNMVLKLLNKSDGINVPVVEEIKGDFFSDTWADVLAHGFNTKANMGGGVAALVQKKHPEVFEAYIEACEAGMFRVGSAQLVKADNGQVFANLGTQINPGPDAQYKYVYASLISLKKVMKRRGMTKLALVKIGAGIGGLEWHKVRFILNKVFDNSEIFVRVYYI